jgi:COP9 signalosome complex subunit 5
MSQTQVAQKRFELENEIVDEEKTYHFDENELQKVLAARPWKSNPDHFKKVKISAVALIKMVMHARSGGDIEVMGLMQGYPVGDTMYVMDAFGLPVEATETRVNAGKEADAYMFAHMDKCTEVARPEYICGWYHSHPGYGCWLSGIDVTTQQNYQKIQDPSVAIVIDPKRTIAAGKVEIGCFRAY